VHNASDLFKLSISSNCAYELVCLVGATTPPSDRARRRRHKCPYVAVSTCRSCSSSRCYQKYYYSNSTHWQSVRGGVLSRSPRIQQI